MAGRPRDVKALVPRASSLQRVVQPQVPVARWSWWVLKTVRHPDDPEDWEPRYPIMKELGPATDLDKQRVFSKMEILAAHGFPPREPCVEYEPCDKKNPVVFVLKGKPSCYRVYFAELRSERCLLYLYSVCKKKWPRDSDDCDVARARLLRFKKGEFEREFFKLMD